MGKPYFDMFKPNQLKSNHGCLHAVNKLANGLDDAKFRKCSIYYIFWI